MMIELERRIHKIFEEFESLPLSAKKQLNYPCFVGKWQYVYWNEKGKISLVKLFGHRFNCQDMTTPIWEIYCLRGDFFEDIERFDTKRDAVKRIKGFLE